MDGYLNTMHHNLTCLARDYDNYCRAAGELSKVAEALSTTVFAFAGDALG